MEIHIDQNATPYACHKAGSVPIHWDKQVYGELLQDESKDVLERVAEGEPVIWQHRMVLTRKHDDRTVDLSRLNKHCKWETHNPE